MSNTMPVPRGASYAVVLLELPPRTAFFRTIEDVVKCMTDLDIAFDCQVVRVQGDVQIWPIESKGGSA